MHHTFYTPQKCATCTLHYTLSSLQTLRVAHFAAHTFHCNLYNLHITLHSFYIAYRHLKEVQTSRPNINGRVNATEMRSVRCWCSKQATLALGLGWRSVGCQWQQCALCRWHCAFCALHNPMAMHILYTANCAGLAILNGFQGCLGHKNGFFLAQTSADQGTSRLGAPAQNLVLARAPPGLQDG